MIEILHRYTRAVLYRSESAVSIAAAVKAARASGADLYGANLRGANLSGADLRSANLRGADLSGADLRSANLYGANLYGANLRSANLRGADLSGADLRSANLYGANLYGANLRSANLRAANLRAADLSGADLCGAVGVRSDLTTALGLLRYQSGPIRALKLVTADGQGPTYCAPQPYVVGESYEAPDANTDETEQCAAGINVASPDWICREYQPGQRVLVVEFSAADIAAIPCGSDGKFRLHRCKVVAEMQPHELGLPLDECAAAEVMYEAMRAAAHGKVKERT